MDQEKSKRLFKFSFGAMGSPCELQLYAAQEAIAQNLAQQAIADVQRLEKKYSRYRADSFLSKVNVAAEQGGSIEVDDETASLLNYADTCYQQSDGLFDITSGVLRKAWNFKSKIIPSEQDIAPLLVKVGWHKVHWQAPVIAFESGMELDFGGIVKEYAADRVAAFCWNSGIHHGLVNLGGDVRVIGPHPNGTPWRIGIQHPRAEGGTALKTIELASGAVATSGDYERCMTINGKKYGHILNPKTGWPVSHLATVTVVADYCVLAGSASTIAMLKAKHAPHFLADMGLSHLWGDTKGNMGGDLVDVID